VLPDLLRNFLRRLFNFLDRRTRLAHSFFTRSPRIQFVARDANTNPKSHEILPDDGSYYGDIPNFEGVYANAETLEACCEELAEVLDEWVLLRVSKSLPLPIVDGLELKVREVA
jgi:predicted RNase H-like HicB family nuclease